MNPWMYDKVKAQLEEYRRKGIRVVVLEAPLLLDVPLLFLKKGAPSLLDEVDKVWVTFAPESVVLKRLKEKSGMSEEQALTRIRSQLSSKERIKHADVVIDTDCTLEELKSKVRALWNKLDT
jgi:dephospho-CoA kinase